MSEYDECLWYGDNIMIVLYVDDCGISAPTQAVIDKFVKDLKGLGFVSSQRAYTLNLVSQKRTFVVRNSD